MLSPERRREIAKAAATARWKKDKPKTRRGSYTLSEADHGLLETLRIRYRLTSHGAVIRKLVREAAKKP